jgi:hypothetical protein
VERRTLVGTVVGLALEVCLFAAQRIATSWQLVLPKSSQGWTLTTLREKLVKTGAKVVRHAKYVVFQLAEAVVRGDPGADRLLVPELCIGLRLSSAEANASKRRRRASVVRRTSRWQRLRKEAWAGG